jgi:hypothetical protein
VCDRAAILIRFTKKLQRLALRRCRECEVARVRQKLLCLHDPVDLVLVLGQIVTALLPSIMAAAQSGDLSIGGIISQAIAGGAGGAILTAIIGAIKNKAFA